MSKFKDLLTKIKKVKGARYDAVVKAKESVYPAIKASDNTDALIARMSDVAIRVRRDPRTGIMQYPGFSFRAFLEDTLTATDYVINLENVAPPIDGILSSSANVQDMIDFEVAFFREYNEQATILDVASIALNSPKLDTTTAVETFGIYVAKQVSDLLAVSDILMYSSGDGVYQTSVAGAFDTISLQSTIIRSQMDALALIDTFETVMTKVLLDSVETLDVFESLRNEGLTKQDALAVIEQVVKSTGTQFIENLIAEENIEKFISKAFIDIIDTDDVLMYSDSGFFSESAALSSLVEIQVASHIDEVLDSYEAIRTEFNKVFVDHAFVDDPFLANSGDGTSTDFSIFADVNDFISFQSQTFRSYLDTLFVDEIREFVVTKHFSDLINHVDTALLSYSKINSDLVTSEDERFLSVEKETSEGVQPAEFLVNSVIKRLVDAISVVDIFDGELFGADQTFLQNSLSVGELFTAQFAAYRSYIETIGSSELLTSTIGKSLLENLSPADFISFVQDYGRALSETLNSNDVPALSMNKSMVELALLNDILQNVVSVIKEDAVTASELFVLEMLKQYSDSLLAMDNTSKSIYKSLISYIATSEEFDAALEGQAFRNLDNYTDITDAISFQLSVFKDYLEAVLTLDVAALSGSKVFSEQAFITQVFNLVLSLSKLEELVVGDLSTMLLDKYTEDTASAIDAAIKSSGLDKSDSIGISDDTNYSTNKYVIETADVSDTEVRSFTKSIMSYISLFDEIDTLIAGDIARTVDNYTDVNDFISFTIVSFKEHLEVQAVVDTIINNLTKVFSDSTTLTDGQLFSITKTVVEILSLSNIAQKLFSKYLLEQLSLSESTAKSLTKDLLDTISATDIFDYTNGEVAEGSFFTNTATISDGGTANIQDYVEANYFAEDYVGTNHTF
jgi:hypothetical protein